MTYFLRRITGRITRITHYSQRELFKQIAGAPRDAEHVAEPVTEYMAGSERRALGCAVRAAPRSQEHAMAGKGSGGRKRTTATTPSIVTSDSVRGGGGDGDADERGMRSDLSPARDPCDPARDPL